MPNEKNAAKEQSKDLLFSEELKSMLKTGGYEMIQNEDGTESLKRFNVKYNMWIKLDFTEEAGDSLANVITELKNNLIRRYL